MDSVYSQHEITERLMPIFTAHPIERAVLFGSYAKGNATPQSDIDLMIDSNGKIRGIDFFGVLEEVSSALNTQVDLLESSQIIKGSRVQKEIENSGVIIYDKKRIKTLDNTYNTYTLLL